MSDIHRTLLGQLPVDLRELLLRYLLALKLTFTVDLQQRKGEKIECNVLLELRNHCLHILTDSFKLRARGGSNPRARLYPGERTVINVCGWAMESKMHSLSTSHADFVAALRNVGCVYRQVPAKDKPDWARDLDFQSTSTSQSVIDEVLQTLYNWPADNLRRRAQLVASLPIIPEGTKFPRDELLLNELRCWTFPRGGNTHVDLGFVDLDFATMLYDPVLVAVHSTHRISI